MKQWFWLLLCLFLGACTTGESTTSTPIAQGTTLTLSATPSLTPTTEPVNPDTPTTIAATATITPTHTPEPTQTPEPISPPTGRIYFMWDPLSRPDDLPDPVHNLYMAVPGETPDDWRVEAVLTSLVGIPVIALSPDKTKLAFTALEDANGDGSVSFQGAAHYLDIPNVFVYSLTNNELERITDNYPWARNLTWSNDSQRLAYQSGTDVYIATHPITGEPELLHSFPGEVQELAWSPDGNYLAVGIYGGEIYLLDTITSSITMLDIEKQASNLTWSPDSQYLVSNEYIGVGLYALDMASLSTINLVGSDFFSVPLWSPNSPYLAFTEGFRVGIGLPLSSSLTLWDTESGESHPLTEAYSNLYALWLPDGQNIVLGFLHEEHGQLMVLDITNNTPTILLDIPGSAELRPLAWSPDGQWLVFHSKDSNGSSLSLIHRTGGQVFQLLDTTDTYVPYGIFWLSN